jgi:hypothetical protein
VKTCIIACTDGLWSMAVKMWVLVFNAPVTLLSDLCFVYSCMLDEALNIYVIESWTLISQPFRFCVRLASEHNSPTWAGSTIIFTRVMSSWRGVGIFRHQEHVHAPLAADYEGVTKVAHIFPFSYKPWADKCVVRENIPSSMDTIQASQDKLKF